MRYRYPDLVFAAVPSSAPVEMRYNYYQYFEVIQKYAPSECVSAIQRVIRFVDLILFNPSAHEDKTELKKKFGVEELVHDDDFAERKYTRPTDTRNQCVTNLSQTKKQCFPIHLGYGKQ